MRSLNELKNGETGSIKWILGSGDALRVIRAFRIQEGDWVHVLKHVHDGMVIACGDRTFLLGDEAACCIKV